LPHQDLFNRPAFGTGGLQTLLQFVGRQHALRDQAVISGGLAPHAAGRFLHALPNGGGQCHAQLQNTFDFQFAEGLIAFVVDDLQHALQLVVFQNGSYQHLAGAVARTLVDFFQKGQGRVNLPERRFVVYVRQVDKLPAEGHVAGNALRRDRQLEFAAAVEAGFDLGDDARPVLIHDVEGQPIGIEQFADVLAGIEHDLLKIFGLVNPDRYLLQLFVKKCLERHAVFFSR